MTPRRHLALLSTSRSSGWLLLSTLCGFIPNCAGTEADNPFMEPAETTSCKSHEDYVSFRRELALPTAPGASSRIASLGEALTAASEVPVWLECVDWDLKDGLLSIQVLNFDGGCAIPWEGGARVTDVGEVVIELENANPGCAVALCGNCIYDVRSQVELPPELSQGDVPFSLKLLPCDGANGHQTDWMLPLASRGSGMLCQLADPWAAAAAYDRGVAGRSDELYTTCDASGTSPSDEPLAVVIEDCGENLQCVNGRCVPECTTGSECPLSGALTCQAGLCQLPQ